MNIKFLPFVLLALLLQACQNETVLRESYDFPENHQWLKSDKKTFTLTVKEAGNYKGFINGSFVYGSQFPKIPITISITKNAVLEKQSIDFKIKNEKGEDIGDCSGDVCDLKQSLFTGKHFEPGTYTFTLENTFEFPYFPNIIALGISLEKEK